MKYFTQQLLDQFTSSNEAVAAEADAKWDRAIVEYKKHLEKVRPYFAPSLRKFLDDYCLHDAEIVSMGTRAGSEQFFIVAHFEPPSNEGVSLTFNLAGPIKGIGSRRSPTYWAYEEVDKVKARDAFRISILFADGSELQIPSSDIKVTRFQVVPSAPKPPVGGISRDGSSSGLRAGPATTSVRSSRQQPPSGRQTRQGPGGRSHKVPK
jgi:hypothetical protein